MITHNNKCLHCKCSFLSKRSDAKYCSDSCRVLAYIERQKKYWQEEQKKYDDYNLALSERFRLLKKQKDNQAKDNEQQVSSMPPKNHEETIKAKELKDLQEWVKTAFENLKRENN